MCYTVRQTANRKELQDRFNADFLTTDKDYQMDEISGFTKPYLPVIASNMPDKIQLFEWGLIPGNETNTLNARIETIREKISFKNYTHQKCLVLINGFYEWQHVENERHNHKYLMSMKDDEPFSLAGLWSQWEYGNGAKFNTFTVITTEAKGIMREIHNSKLRMPVILKRECERDWLEGKATAKLYTDLIDTKIFPNR